MEIWIRRRGTWSVGVKGIQINKYNAERGTLVLSKYL